MLRRLLFRIAAVIVALLAAELLLLGLRTLSPRIDYALSPPWLRITVPDPTLGVRPSPYYPEHDEWGFRNDHVPDECDVLAVGDSMTYGYGAPPTGAWPQQLAARTGLRIYNASFGGYGPCEYLALAKRGLRLHPRVVVVGVFPSNDLVDAYESTWLADRAPQLRPDDDALRRRIEAARHDAPLGAAAHRILAEGGAPTDWPLHRFLAEHGSLWGLMRACLQISTPDDSFRGAGNHGDPFMTASARHGRVAWPDADRTVFLPPALFMLKLDRRDPRIADGERILHEALAAIRTAVGEAGAHLAVLVIPSKQVVYADRLATMTGPNAAALETVVAREREVIASLLRFLADEDFTTVDATQALRAALDAGDHPYPESDDEHPNAAGYAAIASALVPLVQRLAQ